MTHPPDELTWIQICRVRSHLHRAVAALLRGSGLEIRELANHLVIFNPKDPEKGRIYITYTTGEASRRLVTWDYLGPLHTTDPDPDPDPEPAIDAAQIIAILTGQPPPPADPGPGPRRDSDHPDRRGPGSTTIG
ncbi:MAG TPA: hypothetical protein VHY21_14900 [Pseudonocardiaceae bacterium]|jgi:hypothetical protein|nr:hypothetical protein [Pseudonocardiaceae bacterium]